MWFTDKIELQLLLPSFDEAFKAIFDLSAADAAVLIGIALWVLLLALSLKAIDRRDSAACFSYMLFMTAAGTMLILALRARIRGSTDLTSTQALTVAAMAGISAIRWIWRRTPPPRVASTNAKEDAK